jgi:hypothetical protein
VDKCTASLTIDQLEKRIFQSQEKLSSIPDLTEKDQQRLSDQMEQVI